MARDRKRSKQRQRQRRAERRPTRIPGERDTLTPPVPIEGSSAEVELAELAEAGADRPRDDDRDGVNAPLHEDEFPQDDELEPVPGGGERGGRATAVEDAAQEDGPVAEAPARRPPAGSQLPAEGNRFANFLRACVAELRRVQWPDRRGVTQATAVVLGFVIIAGGYLGLLDAVFSRLVNAIL